MREFFQTWRRKVGCITLVMALTFACAWWRSHYQVDVVTVERGSTRQILASTEGRLAWDQRTNPPFGRGGSFGFSLTIRLDLSDKIDKARFSYLTDWSIDWRRRWWGFDFGEGRQLSGTRAKFRAIPYWSIVCCLTLLAGCLIVPKPRAKPRLPAKG